MQQILKWQLEKFFQWIETPIEVWVNLTALVKYEWQSPKNKYIIDLIPIHISTRRNRSRKDFWIFLTNFTIWFQWKGINTSLYSCRPSKYKCNDFPGEVCKPSEVRIRCYYMKWKRDLKSIFSATHFDTGHTPSITVTINTGNSPVAQPMRRSCMNRWKRNCKCCKRLE